MGYDSEFDVRSQNSFYKRTSEKKDRQKELLEEYLEKWAQAKKQQQELLDEKIAKAEQERSRLAKAWAGEGHYAGLTKGSCHWDKYSINLIMGGIGGMNEYFS